MNMVNAIILAGGVSSRFYPLTEKNLYSFLGETNLVTHIKRLQKLDLNRVLIVVNSESENVFKNELKKLKENKNITLLKQQGSGMAGAILTALKNVKASEETLILNANDYYSEELIQNFSSLRGDLFKNKQVLLTGYKTDQYFPGGYLVIKDGLVKDIIEKPEEDKRPSDFVNIVFHYFPEAKSLLDILGQTKSEKDDVYEVALANMMKAGTEFKIMEYSGQWKSIKYPWHVLDVMDFFLASIKGQNISPAANISPSAHIKGDVIIEDGVKIFDSAVINGPVYLGKNTIVANGALVRHSMIGENCVIGFATEVARSYFKSNVWLHKNYVGDSVFEDNISLGSNAVTGNLRLDEQNIKLEVKGNLIDTGRNKLGAIIGSHVRVGINTSLMPGVRIGKGSFIGPGAIVDQDIDENKFVKTESNLVIKNNNFDITKTSREEIKNRLK